MATNSNRKEEKRMRLVKITNTDLINPEHISQISAHIMPAPEGNNSHEYPAYYITMYNGETFVIHRKNAYPNEYHIFTEIHELLNEILGIK